MKALVCSLLLFLSACSCSTREFYGNALPGIPVDVDPSVQLLTPVGGAGHGCPVNNVLITNAHVMLDDKGRPVVAATISQQGKQGLAALVTFAAALDLALLEPSIPLDYLPGGTAAEPGDVVYWFEYDFRTVKNALRGRRRVGKILRIVAGHYVLDVTPNPGASGSCLINEKGEVIGVVNAAFETAEGYAGTAVMTPKDISR